MMPAPVAPDHGAAGVFLGLVSSTRTPACTRTDAPGLLVRATLASRSQTVFQVEATVMAGGSPTLLGSAVSATDARRCTVGGDLDHVVVDAVVVDIHVDRSSSRAGRRTCC